MENRGNGFKCETREGYIKREEWRIPTERRRSGLIGQEEYGKH